MTVSNINIRPQRKTLQLGSQQRVFTCGMVKKEVMVIPHCDKKIQKSKTCEFKGTLKGHFNTHKLTAHKKVKYNCDQNEFKGVSKS